MKEPLSVGQVYEDVDRGGRYFRVIQIVERPAFEVRKPTAVCLVRGKVTAVGIDRLLNPSRFELIPQEPA